MSKDLMFRTTAFGGFKKDEVMDFIEKVLNEKSSLEKRIASSDAKLTQLNGEIASLQSEIADIGKLRSEIAELSAKVNEYEIAIDDKDTLINELTSKLSEAQSKAVDDDEVAALRRENEYLQLELSKKGDLERQVGAAMLDARVHSEELVEQAKERADSVKKAVYAAIGDTAVKIDDLSAGIGEIARNFTKSVAEVELRIKALTGDMSKTAQALISDNILTDDVIAGSGESTTEYDFSVPVVEDEIPFDSKIGNEDY